MYGLLNELYICGNSRVEDLNSRIAQRNFPSSKLQPLFDPRPVQTRYVTMPTIDNIKPANNFIENLPTYNIYKTFNPGSRAPFSGYAHAIDQDSRLKNIFFPLQKCPQSDFIPDTESDLYHYNMMIHPIRMTHNLLFNKEDFDSFDPNKCRVGEKMFHNHTQFQTKNLKI